MLHPSLSRQDQGRVRLNGFTLIELLTVIFIIGLLIAILIPSLTGARNAAKNTSTAAVMNSSIKTGLEMFRSENEKDFLKTNGYPPSFSHPGIGTFQFKSHLGECPYLPEKPTIYGAQWLMLMLTGLDKQGLVQRSAVLPHGNLINNPPTWYGSNPTNANPGKILPRASQYLDSSKIRSSTLNELTGERNISLFPDWAPTDNTPGFVDTPQEIPVLLDAFDQPILYYAGNKFGTTGNMVETVHNEFNAYTGGAQESGQPYYFHQDNIGFTGTEVGDEVGWDFGAGPHAIMKSGADLTNQNILVQENTETFARFILDAGGGGIAQQGDAGAGPLRPANADGYLLISAGVDGRFGTRDDVTNFQRRGS